MKTQIERIKQQSKQQQPQVKHCVPDVKIRFLGVRCTRVCDAREYVIVLQVPQLRQAGHI